jgi:YbgC/YbaW family acyl-CoA thioester hydrolase
MGLEVFSRRELLEAPDPAYVHPTIVRLQDVDAAGVVFFARIFELFNDALLAYCAAEGFPLRQMMECHGVILPVKHASAHFTSPLRLEDGVSTGIVRARLDGDELVVGYRVTARSGRATADTVAAAGTTHHVCIDARSFARSRMPASLAEALLRLEPG